MAKKGTRKKTGKPYEANMENYGRTGGPICEKRWNTMENNAYINFIKHIHVSAYVLY